MIPPATNQAESHIHIATQFNVHGELVTVLPEGIDMARFEMTNTNNIVIMWSDLARYFTDSLTMLECTVSSRSTELLDSWAMK